MQADGLRPRGKEGFELRARALEKTLRFAHRNEPGIHIPRTVWVDSLDVVQYGIEFVQLDGDACVQCSDTVCDRARGVLGKDQAKACDRSPRTRLLHARQPQQSKGETTVCRVRSLTARYSQDRVAHGAAPQ